MPRQQIHFAEHVIEILLGHVAALGDLQTPDGSVPDVVGNFWSFGAALVIR